VGKEENVDTIQYKLASWSDSGKNSQRRRSGQALVEFALIITLVIPLLLGIVDFGRAYYTQVQIKNAVGDAGYYAIQNPGDTAGVQTAIKRQLGNLNPALQNSDITITPSCASGVGKTQIKVSYQYTLLFTWIIPSMHVMLGDETTVPQIDTCS
jgi:Flp pilus assembly protein TadG